MSEEYRVFLASKDSAAKAVGFEPTVINPKLFGFQSHVVSWCLRRGRSAIFLDCGLGKSAIELQWATSVVEHTGKPVLMLTPLAVAKQMSREASKFGFEVNVCRDKSEIQDHGINVLNYDRLRDIEPGQFGGIVLDESSILKSYEGSTRKLITDFGRAIPYRLAATATPAPNDLEELGTHAEFVDAMSRKEMIAQFFTQDGNNASKFRLKGHAVQPFWRWMATWSVAMRKPSDLGYSDDGYVLPELRIHDENVSTKPTGGWLFSVEAKGLQERRMARRDSLEDRVSRVAEIVAREPNESWLIWCDLNDEADLLRKSIPGSVEVRGSELANAKEEKLEAFAACESRIMITKPTIAGFGLNWQHCSRMVFCGISDSYEQQYQSIRRCWRFGQTRPVDVYFVSSEAEGTVVDNVRRKEQQAMKMFDEIVAHMSQFSIGKQNRDRADYNPLIRMEVPSWLQSA